MIVYICYDVISWKKEKFIYIFLKHEKKRSFFN